MSVNQALSDFEIANKWVELATLHSLFSVTASPEETACRGFDALSDGRKQTCQT